MDKNYNELLNLMEDEFNYKLGFSEMSENKFLKFTGDWLLGKTEYQVPKKQKSNELINYFGMSCSVKSLWLIKILIKSGGREQILIPLGVLS